MPARYQHGPPEAPAKYPGGRPPARYSAKSHDPYELAEFWSRVLGHRSSRRTNRATTKWPWRYPPVSRRRAGSRKPVRHRGRTGQGPERVSALAELNAAAGLNRSRAVVDSSHVTPLMPLLDAIPPVRGRPGKPRRKPQSIFADRGYDHDVYRDPVRARGIVPAIARRGTPHGSGLSVYRWVVERTISPAA